MKKQFLCRFIISIKYFFQCKNFTEILNVRIRSGNLKEPLVLNSRWRRSNVRRSSWFLFGKSYLCILWAAHSFSCVVRNIKYMSESSCWCNDLSYSRYVIEMKNVANEMILNVIHHHSLPAQRDITAHTFNCPSI